MPLTTRVKRVLQRLTDKCTPAPPGLHLCTRDEAGTLTPAPLEVPGLDCFGDMNLPSGALPVIL